MAKVDIQSIKQRFGIIGNSELLNRCIDIAVQVAGTDLSVLVTGESGVGKENFPQIIHQFSYRKHGSYIAVNCGAIPEGTIDSELFGHEKGSFTGALADRKGYFEVADKGTIFLDEVGELPLSTQARLLRVLETGEFIKVGSSKVQKTDVRVVAATNLDIPQAIREGKFREDLYYRLNTINIQVPSLRERREDVPILFRKFAADFAQKYQMPTVRLTPEAQDMLQVYNFQGNIRQLKNVAEQISVIEQIREITPEILKNYLPNNDMHKMPVVFGGHEQSRTFNNEREILYAILFDMKKDMDELRNKVDMMTRNANCQQVPHDTNVHYIDDSQPDIQVCVPEKIHTDDKVTKSSHFEDAEECVEESARTLEDIEKEAIKKSLERHKGKRKEVAEELKISERTLYRKIKDYGLESI